uniref:Uncharacterized protein n=1 Tax=Sulfolobus islandicus rod-shaped virus 1 TaxID=157898 RepID=Q5W353_SIRV1|nr:hypothetical protein [Sulfolobus islandicus rod-shaped virus 1]
MSQIVEIPLNLDTSEFFKIEHPGVKKLYRFFKHIENFHNSKISVKSTGNHLYVFVRDSELKIDYDGEIVIKAPSLKIEISRYPSDGTVVIYGDADGYEFEVEFVGKVKVLVRENRSMLSIKVKSLPKVKTY